jgi:hypothetical protein
MTFSSDITIHLWRVQRRTIADSQRDGDGEQNNDGEQMLSAVADVG